MAPKAKLVERAQQRSRGWVKKVAPAAWLLAAVMSLMLLVMWPAIAIYVALAGLPTLAMALVDDDPERRGTLCVGALNFAGSLPFALLALGGTLRTTPLTWGTAYFYPYLGAMVGFAIYVAVPYVLRRIVRVEEERERRLLSERQDALVEEWGANVATVRLDFSRADDAR
ncbi:MAG: hypothetical protein GC202_09075 [Alphaproteobacteria bacterium]|nr:hypothetical protein [Alphaproteobacteria bacterium]